MTPINFTARYIRPANIQKLDGNTYKPHKASLVEMELSDRQAIERVAYDWMEPLAEKISEESVNIGRGGTHIYAVTNQAEQFEKLNPNKVLGMMLFRETPFFETHNVIDYFQVSPDAISPSYGDKNNKILTKIMDLIFKPKKNEHKHVGQALLDSVKDMFGDKPIELYALDEAKSFYIKNGFKKMKGFANGFLNHMEWVK